MQGSQIVLGGGVKYTARKRGLMGRHAEESSRVLPPGSMRAAQASLIHTHLRSKATWTWFVLSLNSGVSVYIPWDALKIGLSSKNAIHV